MRSVRGATLLELVVTFGIVMLAVAVVIPALTSAREQTRLAACQRNLRVLGQGWYRHEASLGFFPSSGWNRGPWTGDPDAGFGSSQPGGWAFDVLAFTPAADLRLLGAGLSEEENAELRIQMHQTPVSFINCPARRPARTYPLTSGRIGINLPHRPNGVVRSDYRANSGNVALGDVALSDATGTTFTLSEVRSAAVADGISKTIAVGEKHMNVDSYYNGNSASDDQTFYVSMNRDVNGYTATLDSRGLGVQYRPRRDVNGLQLNWTFGSAHSSSFNVTFCDSSVRTLSYDIDPVVFWAMGGKSDGPQ